PLVVVAVSPTMLRWQGFLWARTTRTQGRREQGGQEWGLLLALRGRARKPARRQEQRETKTEANPIQRQSPRSENCSEKCFDWWRDSLCKRERDPDHDRRPIPDDYGTSMVCEPRSAFTMTMAVGAGGTSMLWSPAAARESWRTKRSRSPLCARSGAARSRTRCAPATARRTCGCSCRLRSSGK